MKTGTAWSLRKIHVCGDVSVGVATSAKIITKLRGGCITGRPLVILPTASRSKHGCVIHSKLYEIFTLWELAAKRHLMQCVALRLLDAPHCRSSMEHIPADCCCASRGAWLRSRMWLQSARPRETTLGACASRPHHTCGRAPHQSPDTGCSASATHSSRTHSQHSTAHAGPAQPSWPMCPCAAL